MAEIQLLGAAYAAAAGETVLECLERNGVKAPSSCRSGICQSCMMRARSGSPGAAAQQGLRDTLRAQNFFLACMCRPEGDLAVEWPDAAGLRARGRLIHKEYLSDRIMRVRYAMESQVEYRAGQFMNLVGPRGDVRSYSLASVPGVDDFVEFQILLVPQGKISTWIRDEAQVGDPAEMLGPHGSCFYVEGRPEQRLVLAGTGTGLAPLYGVVRDALSKGHTGPIHLYHGAVHAGALYLMDELRALALRYSNFQYRPCVLDGARAAEGTRVGNLQEVVLREEAPLKGARVFLCGDPVLVKGLQKACFKAGAGLKDILADAFLPSKAAATVG
jgi:NAD(P)H-flavin reductase/ferredoxin